MGIQDRDYYHEHRDQVAAADRAQRHQSAQPSAKSFSLWSQIGLFFLICFAVLGVLFMVVVVRAHWLR